MIVMMCALGEEILLRDGCSLSKSDCMRFYIYIHCPPTGLFHRVIFVLLVQANVGVEILREYDTVGVAMKVSCP